MVDVQDQFRETPAGANGAPLPAALQGAEPDTPVMMYCTGGIRCDIYSTYLRSQGFKCVQVGDTQPCRLQIEWVLEQTSSRTSSNSQQHAYSAALGVQNCTGGQMQQTQAVRQS